MRIAQIAPLHEAVPPKLYGGTERVVSYLTEELVRMGHEVTLFASGDSVTSARLIPITSQALRLNKSCADPIAPHVVLLKTVKDLQDEFDIIHFHTDYFHFPLVDSGLRTPHVTTIHNRMDLPELQAVYRAYSNVPLISISQSQRSSLPDGHWVGTVHHGLPRDLYSPNGPRGNELLFLGRISPEKRLDRAVEIAKLAGKQLLIAAKIDQHDRPYFESQIAPLLEQPHVKYLGEIGDQEKRALICSALAMLFPIDWPEPFGIVMIEAMASGVPTIAWRNGSVPEVIDQGQSGFVVESIDEAVAAVHACEHLSSEQVRGVFDHRFTSDIMASHYLEIYETQLQDQTSGIRLTAEGALVNDATITVQH